MVQEKDLSDMVNFTGRISDKQLLEILSTADVCVNPDKPCEMNDISTMIKIMEYMALGKPIVQFDLKEGRFSAGDASLYADNDNQVPDFAAKLLWLLDNPGDLIFVVIVVLTLKPWVWDGSCATVSVVVGLPTLLLLQLIAPVAAIPTGIFFLANLAMQKWLCHYRQIEFLIVENSATFWLMGSSAPFALAKPTGQKLKPKVQISPT